MSRFTTALEGAILAGTRRIVFIHGVGNGRLKHEILKTLNRKYPKLRYQDASFKKYGYGATLVMLK
jgi:dsDNA-specific endonuclease/ATPase MutS2